MSSRKLTDLHPLLEGKAIALMANCKVRGVELLIYCTYRSWEEQNRLYDIGRGVKGKIATWARGGESLHNHTLFYKPCALAFDCVPLIAGKPYWTLDDTGAKLWAIVGEEAHKLGLVWGANWSINKREYPHFQLNLRDLQNVKNNQTQN